MKITKRLWFTLIEIMIVTTIIGMMSAIAVPKIINVVDRSRDTQRMSDVSKIALSLNSYYVDNSRYPAHVPNVAAAWREVSTDATWMNSLGKYLPKPPRDPKNSFTGNPWANTGEVRSARMYAYYNYGNYTTLPLYNCNLKNYIVLGVTELQASPPIPFAKCPSLDRSTMFDYGYVLSEWYIYNGTNGNAIVRQNNAVAVSWSTSTWSTSTWSTSTWSSTVLPWTWFNVWGPAIGWSWSCSSVNISSTSAWTNIQCHCTQAQIVGTVIWTNPFYRWPGWSTCRSARHAGAIPASGGNVWLLVSPPVSRYYGTTQNGITSNGSNGQGSKSFQFFIL